ncbi:MAG: TlyA family RNA methyltransferase [Thermodesulfobacteriota bacterium]|nr:TlyA family RNA methyltransferase [Thermodesulfobacteriota bacterium]
MRRLKPAATELMAERLSKHLHKQRLDKILVDQGLVSSRERARALIMAGSVLINGVQVTKAGAMVPVDASILLKEPDIPYVSRGGLKLEEAIKTFGIDIQGRVAIDVGASTGGFTDCLLKHGARRVYAIDVGYGQLDWTLRQDGRVISLERKNIRYLGPEDIGEKADIAVIDVSFISLSKVIPVVVTLLKEQAEIVALVKPQFEVGKGQVGKGGIVRDPALQTQATEKIQTFAGDIGLISIGLIESPILGAKGNREFLLYLKKGYER